MKAWRWSGTTHLSGPFSAVRRPAEPHPSSPFVFYFFCFLSDSASSGRRLPKPSRPPTRSPPSPRVMLRLPTLLPLKPSTPASSSSPIRRGHDRRPAAEAGAGPPVPRPGTCAKNAVQNVAQLSSPVAAEGQTKHSARLLVKSWLRPCRRPKRLLASSSAPPPPPPKPRPPKPTPTSGQVKPKPKHEARSQNPDHPAAGFPATKPRRGRRSEAAAVEDFVRGRLEQVLASIRESNPEVLEGKGDILKQKEEGDEQFSDGEEGEKPGEEEDREQKPVVEEEDPSWPLDADIGWGIRASEYFDKHSIRNVTVDGVEIDWEREVDEGWVKEINCLEWESFAFHPSPLVVLVFERYNRAADNWKFLQELEKAAKVYWNAKDRLPPRTVKIDINIERDLAYALQAKECPQLLFLRGNKILYREKEIRTADELVQMIAHFYYNAKRPSCVIPEAVAPL